MNTPHKHAEVLRAIADGKTVQWRSDAEWHDAEFEPYTPMSKLNLEWRVKPEPKPDVVAYIGIDNRESYSETFRDCLSYVDHWNSQVKFIFDGETGKLKSAEVLK